MYILLEYVIVLDLAVVTCIVHPNEHVIDAQKVTQQYKETGGHNTLQKKEEEIATPRSAQNIITLTMRTLITEMP